MATPAKAKEAPLAAVYQELAKLLKRHSPPFKICDAGARGKSSLQLTVPKPVAIPGAYGGKPIDLMLAAAILQKGYVGFYLMCVYMNAETKKKLSPSLLKLLKGKSCFHVKKLDEGLKKDIEAALELGTKLYKERGWV